jgi:hypothetical protein
MAAYHGAVVGEGAGTLRWRGVEMATTTKGRGGGVSCSWCHGRLLQRRIGGSRLGRGERAIEDLLGARRGSCKMLQCPTEAGDVVSAS